MSARLGWLLLALVAALQVYGLARMLRPPERPPGPPTLVLVLFDGAARERLSVYGYDQRTTPHLAALARGGLAHPQYVPESNGANACLATLLTGRLPREHGVGALDAARGVLCPAELPTLAERLAARGFRCVAALSLAQLAPALTGLGRGFELCDAPTLDPLVVHRPARATFAALRPALEELAASDAPAFVLLHMADARARRLDELPGAGRFVRERLAPFARHDAELEAVLDDLPLLARYLLRRRGDPARVAFQSAVYDAALWEMDAQLGALLEQLERGGRDPLVAVCGMRAGVPPLDAASGERVELEAPLVLRAPRGRASGQGVAQGVDLTASLLAAAGAELEGSRGRDLFAGAGTPRAAGFFEDARFVERCAVGRAAWLRESVEEGERLVLRMDTPPSADELAALRAELDAHPPLGRVRVAAGGALAFEAEAKLSTLAPLIAAGRVGARQEARLDGGELVLRAAQGRPDLALRLAADGLEETTLAIGGRALSELDLGLLHDPAAPERAEDAPPVRARIQRVGAGWSEVLVGLAPGLAARAVVELLPASPELALDSIEADPGVALTPHPRRPGAVVLEGASPLRFRVRQRPSNEPAYAFFLDGERVPASALELDGRAFTTPGALRVALSASAWSDPALYASASDELSPPLARVELLAPPPPGPVPTPDAATVRLLQALASTE